MKKLLFIVTVMLLTVVTSCDKAEKKCRQQQDRLWEIEKAGLTNEPEYDALVLEMENTGCPFSED